MCPWASDVTSSSFGFYVHKIEIIIAPVSNLSWGLNEILHSKYVVHHLTDRKLSIKSSICYSSSSSSLYISSLYVEPFPNPAHSREPDHSILRQPSNIHRNWKTWPKEKNYKRSDTRRSLTSTWNSSKRPVGACHSSSPWCAHTQPCVTVICSPWGHMRQVLQIPELPWKAVESPRHGSPSSHSPRTLHRHSWARLPAMKLQGRFSSDCQGCSTWALLSLALLSVELAWCSSHSETA